jgi:D-aminopeptidase
LLAVLCKIEARGAVELARLTVGQIFRYAIATGRAERDIAADLRDALQAKKERHHPTPATKHWMKVCSKTSWAA